MILIDCFIHDDASPRMHESVRRSACPKPTLDFDQGNIGLVQADLWLMRLRWMQRV